MTPRFEDLVVTRWGARFCGAQLPCAVGVGGIGKKRGEGDGVTPNGAFEIKGIRYRSDRLMCAAPHIPSRPIGLFDVWSDDPDDPNYNHDLRAHEYAFGHEKLRRSDGLYDAFGILDYNWPNAVAGAGSAIFIHVWRKPRHPTQGCIAFSRDDLMWIFAQWRPRSRVIICG